MSKKLKNKVYKKVTFLGALTAIAVFIIGMCISLIIVARFSLTCTVCFLWDWPRRSTANPAA